MKQIHLQLNIASTSMLTKISLLGSKTGVILTRPSVALTHKWEFS